MKSVAQHLEEQGMTLDQLIAACSLEPKVVKAIVTGNYTPSPVQRQRIAVALGVTTDEVSWGHTVEVKHLWGHGPQFGRTP